jgi:eukaryotic-like serine/threonine-protein kinase
MCKREFPDGMVFCPFDGVALEHPDGDLLIGRTLDGKYRLEAKLGAGGMGAVYRASHVPSGTMYAVKVLHTALVGDAASVARFRREAETAARVHHANAIAVNDFGVTADHINYIVMELFEGESLRDRLRHEGKLRLEEACEVARQLCAALQAMHAEGIVHRDVKPENIFIARTQEAGLSVKILDFGIAKVISESGSFPALTHHGAVVGSPHYLSPEQCNGDDLDSRSDVYSLGVVLYEMLTGVVPFTAATPVAVALMHANTAAPPLRVRNPLVPQAVEAVVLRALSKKREDRQDGAARVAQELERAVRLSAGSGSAARLEGPPTLPPALRNPPSLPGLTPPVVAPGAARVNVSEVVVSDPASFWGAGLLRRYRELSDESRRRFTIGACVAVSVLTLLGVLLALT